MFLGYKANLLVFQTYCQIAQISLKILRNMNFLGEGGVGVYRDLCMEDRKCDGMTSITVSQSFVWDATLVLINCSTFHFQEYYLSSNFWYCCLAVKIHCKRSIVYVGCFWHGKKVPLPLVNIKNLLNFFILTSISLCDGKMLRKIEVEVCYSYH